MGLKSIGLCYNLVIKHSCIDEEYCNDSGEDIVNIIHWIIGCIHHFKSREMDQFRASMKYQQVMKHE